MPPEASSTPSAAHAALAHWRELRGVYDALDVHVGAAAWAGAAALAPRIAALEQALLPLMTASRAHSDAAELALWSAGDAIATDLAERRERMFAVATAARQAVAAELASVARGRDGARRYRSPSATPLRFTSRLA
jgi:hypothetical protein